MTGRVIILRPQPGADATAERAQALGLDPVITPLSTIEPLTWSAPDPARFDALMLTSANAARTAGPGLARYAGLPLFVVGEATARTARELGLEPVAVGDAGVSALLAMIADAGYKSVLHLSGADVVEADSAALDSVRIPVYRAAESVESEALLALLQPGDVLLVHSPRAGKRLAAILTQEDRANLSIIAISPAALAVAGHGWAVAQSATSPTDAAVLALALELCHKTSNHAPARPEGSEMDSEPTIREQIAPAPVLTVRPRKSRAVRTLILFLLAFVGGVAVTVWAAPILKGWFDRHGASGSESALLDGASNSAENIQATNPESVSDLETRLAAVSAKLDNISQQASDAGGNAGRAEALLIAFAARRALDRGASLGYLEGELRLRFADAQPRAVATIINAAASPVTIADLQARLDDLTPALTGADTKADWWASAKEELSSLIIVRKAGAPSAEPQKVLERTNALLSSGRIDAAIREIERLPNRAKAESWLQMARQYNEARRALDVIEAAAILEPKRLPLPQESETDEAPAG